MMLNLNIFQALVKVFGLHSDRWTIFYAIIYAHCLFGFMLNHGIICITVFGPVLDSFLFGFGFVFVLVRLVLE